MRAAALVAALATAAAPVQGSISGPVTAVSGKTITVKTTLSPTGSSKVTVGAKAIVTERIAGTKADLKKGACVMASGTKKGTTVTAARISITACNRPRGNRPANGTRPPRTGNGRRPGGGQGFTPPVNVGFAFGTIQSVKGATLTVKGFQGSTTVAVGKKVQIEKTATVPVSAISKSLCAFVFGTSKDKGKTVTATNVSLTKPVSGSCNAPRFGR
jgi:hypothetical protein